MLLVLAVGLQSCSSESKASSDTGTTDKVEKAATQTASTTPAVQANNSETQNEQATLDEQIIKDYLKANNLQAERDPSGVYYIIEEPGGEAKPGMQDQLSVHYHGTLLDGTVFDSSVDRGQPIEFQLGGVVKGWQIGIPKFGKGGKGSLIIPSGLAYGPRARGKIPANAVLRFDIEVVDFKSKEEFMKEQEAVAAKANEAADASMQAYISEKGLKAQKDDSGLYWTVEKQGTDPKPTVASTVKVHYHGTLLDGTVFDSSVDRGEPIEFPLARVVKGWQIGIPKFGTGGKGKLIIPPGLGYGNRAAGSIPPNSVLVFDVEVLEVK